MKLTNCEKQNKKNSKTFLIPPAIIRRNLRKGDSAKLIFEMSKSEGPFNAERMWVKIVENTSNGYMGKLNNTPILFDPDDLAFGDEICFEAKYIADVELKKTKKAKKVAKK